VKQQERGRGGEGRRGWERGIVGREKKVDDVCRLRTGNRYKLGGFKNSKDRQAQSVE